MTVIVTKDLADGERPLLSLRRQAIRNGGNILDLGFGEDKLGDAIKSWEWSSEEKK